MLRQVYVKQRFRSRVVHLLGHFGSILGNNFAFAFASGPLAGWRRAAAKHDLFQAVSGALSELFRGTFGQLWARFGE